MRSLMLLFTAQRRLLSTVLIFTGLLHFLKTSKQKTSPLSSATLF